MKSFFSGCLLLFACVFIINTQSVAQTAIEMNDKVFTHVRDLINTEQGDSLYALLDDDFKSKFSNEAFTGILKNNLYPLGPIIEYSLISYNAGTTAYKSVCSNATLEFRISTDKTGKITGLRFLPYKPQALSKTSRALTDNPLRTILDKQLDTIARNYIDKANTVGMAISILKNDTVTNYGYGETVKGNNKIPGADAIFELGSVTKTFTATLLAYYVVLHKVALSDPITEYLPDSVAANTALQKITLQMLSNHTSGLSRMPDNIFDSYTDGSNPYKNYNENKLFAYLKDCKLKSVPGENYAYSNLAAGLLGIILERISGSSYEQLVTDIICQPLGMNNTIQNPDASQKQREVAVYNEKGDSVIMWDINGLSGAGALRSDSRDMMKYVQANMKTDKTHLSKAMQLAQKVTYTGTPQVGLGWHIDDIAGTKYYWHNGATGGSRSFIAFIPGKDIAIVILSNSAEDVDDTGRAILKILE